MKSGFRSRNGQIHDPSSEERKQLGCVEYKAIKLLAWLVPIYFQTFGAVALGSYFSHNKVDAILTNGVHPW